MAFKITARTVLELGSELISSDIIAFYELIKNAFDAGTSDGAVITFDVVLRRNAYLQLGKKIAEQLPALAADDILAALNQDAPPELLTRARSLIEDSRASRPQLTVALEMRISAIVDAWNRLIVDGETTSPRRRWGSAQALRLTVA